MRTKTADEQYSIRKAIIHISILLTVAVCIGTYLVSTAVLIAEDGTAFIEYAKNLETSPIKAMKKRSQHPGYPLLIIAAHKILETEQDSPSLQNWIYSAQTAALIFRLLTVVLLYFTGEKIVGQRFSFLAILILILLPDAAEYGSDALSDWPHIFFLSAGFLLLIWAAVSRKWWLFGFSGIAAGMGYLIRPECAQVVVFGSLWLVVQVFYSGRVISRCKAVFALALLLAGFLAIAGPYMKLKGAVFPKKQLVQLAPNIQSSKVYEQEIKSCSNNIYAADFSPSDIVKAWGKMVQRVGETLMWFFVPALLIGIYKHFEKRKWCEPERFFFIALMTFNVLVLTLLYCKFGYMSRRHTLPLVVLTIFYVPVGLDVFACQLGKKFSKTANQSPAVKANTDIWFLVLLVTGICICSLRLLEISPIRIEKQSYREAARWLAENTDEKDIIAATDIRIGFYSGRRSVKYNGQVIPKEAQYIVKVLKDEQNTLTDKEMLKIKEVFSVEGKDRKYKVVIYRQNR